MKEVLNFQVRSASIVIQNIAIAPITNTDSPYFPVIRKCFRSQKAGLSTFGFLLLTEGSML